jgi:hypothetical protein
MKKLFAFVVLACLASFLAAEEKKADAKKPMGSKMEHTVMAPGDMQWGDAPPVFPAGAKMAVLAGDPNKAGPYTVRLKLPDGYRVASHWHPAAENLTVISGEFHLGVGDKFDESQAKTMAAGSFGSMPARMHHYAWTKGETEVQVHGNGPFKLIYVNPADDPSKMKK